MPAGFRQIGDHGLVQIDENFFAMSMMATGDVSAGPNEQIVELGSAYAYRFTYEGDQPVFGVYIPASLLITGGIYRTSKSGSSWSVDIALTNNNGTHTISAANRAAIRWFAFDRPKQISGAGQGLRVWDAAGRLTFSSDWITVCPVPPSGFQPGRKYAMVGGLVGLSYDLELEQLTTGQWQATERYWLDGYYCPDGGIEGNGVGIAAHVSGVGGGGPGVSQAWAASGPLFGIDVTRWV